MSKLLEDLDAIYREFAHGDMPVRHLYKVMDLIPEIIHIIKAQEKVGDFTSYNEIKSRDEIINCLNQRIDKAEKALALIYSISMATRDKPEEPLPCPNPFPGHLTSSSTSKR